MSLNPTSRNMTALLHLIAAGRIEAIDRYFDLHAERVALATRLIGRDSPDATRGDPEDAVQDTWVKLCQDARAGMLDGVESLDALQNLFDAMLRCRIGITRRHFARRKRGGNGGARAGPNGNPAGPGGEGPHRGPAFHRSDLGDLDRLFSPAPAPDVLVASQEQVEWLLVRLDDPTLRTIVRRRMEGLTNEELGRELGLTTRTIERGWAMIRTLISRLISR